MNVGDYVRTRDGKIFKWNKHCTTSKEDYNEHTRKLLFDENEIKSSPQIIDLIEVGDYVNGDYVTKEVPKDKRKKQIIIVDSTCAEYGDLPLNNDEIETIVTHEQMEAMQYRVEK